MSWGTCCVSAWVFQQLSSLVALLFIWPGTAMRPLFIAYSKASLPTCTVCTVSRVRAIALNGRGIIQLGLLFLIATPVARVIFSIWGFAAEHDRMYVAFTVIVLAVLLFSLVGSQM